MDSRSRSIAKAVSYRTVGSVMTAMIVYAFGGRKIALSAGVGTVDALLKVGLYFLHERIWNRIPCGQAARDDPQNSAGGRRSGRPANNGAWRESCGAAMDSVIRRRFSRLGSAPVDASVQLAESGERGIRRLC